MNDVVFEQDFEPPVRPLLSAGSGYATSPVAAALVRAHVVPNERAARFAVLSLAVLGAGAAFASIYISAPEEGVAGVTYEELTPEERAKIPAAERAYLENAALARREREAAGLPPTNL